MTAAIVTVRDEVFDRIEARKVAATFVINDFDTEKTWYPRERLEDLTTDHPSGKVYVIGMAADDGENKSRTNLSLRESPVMVGYQRAGVDPEDTALLDKLLELEEQLREVCRKDIFPDADNFSWLRIESLKDENGTPYAYMGLREANLFEAYFTTFYNLVLP